MSLAMSAPIAMDDVSEVVDFTTNANISVLERALYLTDPVKFVQDELGEEPTEDQAKFLMECADLLKKNFIISAGRGSGKTLSVSWLLCWSVAILPQVFGRYTITILSGSGEQAAIMYSYFTDYIEGSPMLKEMLVKEPTKKMTRFRDGSWVKVLTASMKQAAGPHPDLLVVDEVCIADDRIVRKALMQAVGDTHGRTIMLSTPSEMFGIFKKYWNMAPEYGYERVGPWPLTRCPWVSKEELVFWKRQFPPDYFLTEVMGEFATSVLNVYDLEAIADAYSHGVFGINPNYPVYLACDWGKIPPAKTVLLAVQFYDGFVHVCSPEMFWQYEKYPEVQKKIKYFAMGKRVEMFYGDASHIGENERVEEYIRNVQMVSFTNLKPRLVDISIFLFWHRKVKISADLVVMKEELFEYSYEERRGKTRYRKGDDDFVDAFSIFCYKLHDEGFETHRDVAVKKPPPGWGME